MEQHNSATRLFIRAASTPEREIYWFDDQTESHMDIHRLGGVEHLNELAIHPATNNVCLFIPASEVVFRQVNLPQRASTNTSQMVAYLTEESIASDVDTLFWADLYRQEQTLFVAGIEEEYLKTWLQRLNDAGLKAKQVYIDALLLPLSEEGWSIAQLDDQWLVRQSEYSGFLAEQVLFDAVLTIEQPAALNSFGHEEMSNSGPLNTDSASCVLITMKNNSASATNLLQGKFAVREEEPAWTRNIPRIAAGMAIFTLILVFGVKLFTLWQVTHQESLLKDEMLALHQRYFPQDKHTRNLKFYFAQNMKKAPTSFLALLAKLTEFQAKTPQIAVDKIEYQPGQKFLTLQITTSDRTTIDNFVRMSADDFHLVISNITTSPAGMTATLTQRGK